MVRRRSPDSALALSGAPSRTVRPPGLILRDAAKQPLLRMRGVRMSLRLVAALLAAGLEQEPGAALGFVDEGFEQSGGAGILVIVGELVGFSHRGRDVLVVFHQLAQHVARRDVALVVVLDGLQFPYLSDRG